MKSPQAVQTTLAIVETFAKLRELTRTVALIPSAQEQSEQKSLLQHCSDVLDDLISHNLPMKSTETSFELNLAMFKLKHTVKREEDELKIEVGFFTNWEIKISPLKKMTCK